MAFDSDQPSGKTFFHRAAKYSLLAPIFGMAIMSLQITYELIQGSNTRGPHALAALIYTVLAVTSGPAAIIALFGMLRYGRAGILWRAIAGLLFFTFLVCFPLYFKIQEKSQPRHVDVRRFWWPRTNMIYQPH